MIRFACPGCSATFTVADEKAGKSGKCPKCESKFVIPNAPAGDSLPAPPTSKPSLPPLPPAADQPVEIQPCPKCDSRLSVMATDIGLDIECPNCQTVFKALKAGSAVSKPAPSKRPADDEDDRPSRRGRPADDDEEEDRPKKSKRRDDDEEDERPSRKGSKRGGLAALDDEEDDRPKKRSSRYDDEDEEDDRPRSKSRSRSGGGKRRSSGGRTESKKMTAGLLGLFLGSLGVHKFYLGYSSAGVIQIVLTIVTCGLAGWIGVIEGILYLTKTDEDFIETYQRNEKQWF